MDLKTLAKYLVGAVLVLLLASALLNVVSKVQAIKANRITVEEVETTRPRQTCAEKCFCDAGN